MKEVFKLKEPSSCAYAHREITFMWNVKTTCHGIQLIKYLAPKIWNLVPDQIKQCGSLTKSKHFIKS